MQSRVCDSVVCVPDALKNLVGEDNARRGTIKVFEVLQNKTLNKHLIYVSVCGVLSSELPGMLLFFLVCLCKTLNKHLIYVSVCGVLSSELPGMLLFFLVCLCKTLNKHLIYVSVCGVLSSELPGMLLFFLVCLCSRELMPSGIGAVLWLRHRQ